MAMGEMTAEMERFAGDCAWDKEPARLARARGLAGLIEAAERSEIEGFDLARWMDRCSRSAGPEATGAVVSAFARAGGLDARLTSPREVARWMRLAPEAVGQALSRSGALERAFAGAPSLLDWWAIATATEKMGAAVDQLLDESLLAWLAPRESGVGWAVACLAFCEQGRFEKALAAGIDLAKASPEMAGEALRSALALSMGALDDEGEKASPGALAHKRQSAELKSALWRKAAACGLPAPRLVNDPEEMGALGGEIAPSGEGLLQQAAALGWAIDGGALRYWTRLALQERDKGDKELWGAGALSWAFGHGMDPKAWSESDARDAMESSWSYSGASTLPGAASFLEQLAKAKVQLDERSAIAARAAAGEPEKTPLIRGFAKAGKSEKAIKALVALGADPFATLNGASILSSVAEGAASARTPKICASLLAAAESAEPGGAKKLCEIKGKDGSSALHWMARALCAKSVELIAKTGADIHARDKRGATAGHWAAKRYSPKVASKVGPTLEALTNAGFDWSSLSKDGVSALAALSTRGPIEPIADLVRSGAAGEALGAKGVGKRAQSAEERLRERSEPEALPVVEQAELERSLGGATPAAGRKGKSL